MFDDVVSGRGEHVRGEGEGVSPGHRRGTPQDAEMYLGGLVDVPRQHRDVSFGGIVLYVVFVWRDWSPYLLTGLFFM